MAIAQNLGTFLTAMLPALFTLVAPPGTNNVPMVIGTLIFAVTCMAALAAYLAPETYRVPLQQLGAHALPKDLYDTARAGLHNGQ